MIRLSVASTYENPRAPAVRERYLGIFGGPELPVPVEAIAEDLLGLPVEGSWELGDCFGMLLPADRRILLNAAEAKHEDVPIRQRAVDLTESADRTLEREADILAAELLMPEDHVWAAFDGAPEINLVSAPSRVSPSAAHSRLYSFGLVAERPA